MLQLRYVRDLLLDVAGVRDVEPEDETPKERGARQRRDLEKAVRRAFWVLVLDAAALAVLLGWRLRAGDPLLPLGRNEETIFTLGVLTVAAHFGFRLAQRFQMKAVLRAWDELPE